MNPGGTLGLDMTPNNGNDVGAKTWRIDMAPEQLLAIDAGTQSVRALIFDLQGNMIARSRVVIEPYFSTGPGLAEQHPRVFWDAVCEACQTLWKQPNVDKKAIAGVSVTTQRCTFITSIKMVSRFVRPSTGWINAALLE